MGAPVILTLAAVTAAPEVPVGDNVLLPGHTAPPQAGVGDGQLLILLHRPAGAQSQTILGPGQSLCVGTAAVGDDAHAGVPHSNLSKVRILDCIIQLTEGGLLAACISPATYIFLVEILSFLHILFNTNYLLRQRFNFYLPFYNFTIQVTLETKLCF